MFLRKLLSLSSALNVKAVGFCEEVLPEGYEVVTVFLLKIQVF
jgi:hypothetical protein